VRDFDDAQARGNAQKIVDEIVNRIPGFEIVEQDVNRNARVCENRVPPVAVLRRFLSLCAVSQPAHWPCESDVCLRRLSPYIHWQLRWPLARTRSVTITPAQLSTRIAIEMALLSDVRVIAHIRSLLVAPVCLLRAWDYGTTDQSFPCWSVLELESSNTGIAYCENGYGPAQPWGLVALTGQHMSMGVDSAWFPRFLDAYFDSAAADLPIWRVYQSSGDHALRTPISPEGTWDETWTQVEHLRAARPQYRYDCDQSIYRSGA
jgi:hypothetical protein